MYKICYSGYEYRQRETENIQILYKSIQVSKEERLVARRVRQWWRLFIYIFFIVKLVKLLYIRRYSVINPMIITYT